MISLLLSQMESSNDESEMIEMFKILDRDSNGIITAKEIKYVMNGLGEHLSNTDAEAMIAEADMGGDGMINFGEFALMMKRK